MGEGPLTAHSQHKMFARAFSVLQISANRQRVVQTH